MTRPSGYEEYGFVAEFYDHVIPYKNREDVEFYVNLARECGGPVLELGCGTGRILLPVARAGMEITGLDLSPFMLQVCRDRLERESPEVRSRARLVEADMRRFELDQTFPLVTVPFRAFQHLTAVEDQMACLRAVRSHLQPDGKLILDLFNPSLPALADQSRSDEWGDEPVFTMPDGREVLRKARIAGRSWFEQIQDVELIYYVSHPGGRKERLVHAFPMRYLFRYEAEHLLARCGFNLEAVYGDFAGTPFGGAPYPGELICVARAVGGEA